MGNCQDCMSEELQVPIQQYELTIEPSVESIQGYSLTLDVKTWQKESYSLFDYESNTSVLSQTFSVSGECYIFSREGRVLQREGLYRHSSDEVLLLPLELNNDQFEVMNYRFNQLACELVDMKVPEEQDKLLSENQTVNMEVPHPMQKMKTGTNRLSQGKGPKIWMVVRSIETQYQGVSLVLGDVVKLGRVKLIVRKIQSEPIDEPDENALSAYSDDNDSQNDRKCRICLSATETTTNPLIDPCKCSGSTKFIHLKCLLYWLQHRDQSKCNNYCTVFIWKNLKCEICQFIYPPQINSEGKTYDLIALSRPRSKPYVIFELQQKKQHDQETQGNGLYIINFGTKKELRIGRNHEVEISINDISVSRKHAVLKMVNGKIVLQDNKSKFGTLLLLQNNIELVTQLSGLELQVKRSLFQFHNGPTGCKDQDLYIGRQES